MVSGSDVYPREQYRFQCKNVVKMRCWRNHDQRSIVELVLMHDRLILNGNPVFERLTAYARRLR